MPPKTSNSYDAVPFQGHSVPRSHPLHLATLATLLGLEPPDVERCCVLELGCAEGANLLPIAARYPGCRCVGLDYSQRQIDAGRELAGRLELSNIELVCRDIMQTDDTLGSFDYIIAHGVFSWVPDGVRQRVLDICGTSLSPTGIAYISYNTDPGGHVRRMVRSILSYHVRRTSDPLERVARAREFLDFLISSIDAKHAMYRSLLEWERNHMAPFPDHQVRHDLFADDFTAHRVSDVLEEAGRRGLQFLGEADVSQLFSTSAPSAAADVVSRISKDVAEHEQYMDFFLNRAFRETLLCRSDQRLNRRVEPSCISRYYLASPLVPKSTNPDVGRNSRETFGNSGRGEISADAPLTKAALCVLAEAWPRNIDFPTLVERARAAVASAQDDRQAAAANDSDTDALIDALWQGVTHGLIELSLHPSACSAGVGDRPLARGIVRRQAERGEIATNERHENVRIDPLQRRLLPHLDGTRDRQALVQILADTTGDGSPAAERTGETAADRAARIAALSQEVEAGLNRLAQAALLTG